ncbi:MAG TPA: hypothetical protein DCZ03_07015 [Gammaproteobacteria bacterium]|nr:hypothetical protein [Gammaproteobacteria bacterium]
MKPKIGPGAKIHETAQIYSNVELGANVVIEAYAIIGYPAAGDGPQAITKIGANSRVRTHSIIYAGVEIGEECHIGHQVLIREATQIGEHSSIGGAVIIEHHCVLGSNVRIQGQAGLSEHTIVEADVWIGPRVITSNVLHPTCDRAKECLAGPIIRRGAILGSSAVLSPDIEIGERALIGAGSIVTKSVPRETIMFGNPARKIGEVEKISCPYDMKSNSPYAAQERELGLSEPSIPLVDLQAQHQTQKQELRLAMDRVILNSRFINGKEVVEFEQAYAEFCQTKYAVGVSSGTDALILILQALGIGPGDEVITTPHTFIATAEAIHSVGARAVFVDIEPDSFNLNPKLIAEKISEHTKAIMPVHLYGRPANMSAITQIARKYQLEVIEDAAQAHGALFEGRVIGGIGRAAGFSFFPGKNLGAYGDAGGITTNDEALAAEIKLLRDHGRISKYESAKLSGNYRLDTLQAAVLQVKLKRLTKRNQSRQEIAESYRQGLKNLPIILPESPANATHVYHQFVIQTSERQALQAHLADAGIASGIHYPVPLHLQRAFCGANQPGAFPQAEAAAAAVLSLPMYPELQAAQIKRVVQTIIEFFERSTA